MKRILLSLMILGATGALAVGVSRAFFSDQEKSTGNTFTAGSLDLRFQVEGAAAKFTDVNGSPLFNANIIPLLADMKPGDKGERTVKLWVDNNPSCGKVSVNVTEDKDNSCTGPELIDDPSCVAPDTAGELNDQVNFAVWADPDCNNVLDEAETILTSGTVTEDKSYGIGELPISEATAKCYGIAYCFGAWNPTNGTCDGSLVNNAAQTDSFKADLIIDALQKRNQYDQGCPVGDLPTPTPEVVSDYLNIGDVTSEVGHNLLGWSDAWNKPGWGGNYGGGSSDSSLRLLMGHGDVLGCADTARPATFTMNAGAGTATKLTLEHLDGQVNDSFDVKIDGNFVGHYTAGSSGSETWVITPFTFSGVTGVVNVELATTNPVASWCADWGQVAFSNAKLE